MSDQSDRLVFPASALAINGRALLLEGEPGSGKSSLALALIERGAQLIGDDAVVLTREDRSREVRLIASPPPNIEGLLEVRGVGLLRYPVAPPTQVALILSLDAAAARLPDAVPMRELLGCSIPALPFEPGTTAPAERALAALKLHGLALPDIEG
ncbi:MAG: HPr kinase/phosphatase C-terminal domain-containing protein [Pseudomonadota bacterium]